MTSVFKNVLSLNDIQYLHNLPEVMEAKASGKTFFIELTDSIRTKLDGLGLDLSKIHKIPMRWIQGDTAPHSDQGTKEFQKTVLVYLNDSKGEIVIGDDSFPIVANTAFLFNEGIVHKTVGAETRLLIGPMSEFADPVGGPLCFLGGSKILCKVDGDDVYIPIETIKPGTFVKTLSSGWKPVALIKKSQIENPGHSERIQHRLYKCSRTAYPELTDDLFITGSHAILVPSLTATQRKKVKEQLGKVFITENRYRLMSSLDERAEPWASQGRYTIWHIALENPNIHGNYGIWANGLLVETCNIQYLKEML